VQDSFIFAEKIPNDYDVIVGLPRAGLIVASIIASKFGRPLSTPNNFVRGEVWKSRTVEKPRIRRILLVDEIIASGQSMRLAVEKLLRFDSSLVIHTAALLRYERSVVVVDYNLRKKDYGLVLEWETVKEQYGDSCSNQTCGMPQKCQ
jgi:hypoxanthine phosphoribosyltransferase